MKNTLTTGAALLLTTTAAFSAGIDRSGNGYGILFEDGNRVELSFSSVTPDISGDYPAGLPFGGGSTNNMAESYISAGVAFKYQINDDFDVAVYLNQPYGANALYTGGAYTGLAADWSSTQAAAVVKYQAAPGVSVYGGLRSVTSKADIAIPDALIRGGLAASGTAQGVALATGAPAGTLGYTATTESDSQIGYILGVAYERPEIALRVGLTYESGFTHAFNTTELIAAVPTVSGDSVTDIEIPDAITLDFQTGIAADTLLFGSIRYAEWSVWEVRPQGYEALTGDRVTGLDNDTTTYRVGVGRRINEDLSVFARVTYEEGFGDVASRLSPTDGSTAIGIGGSYTYEGVEFTGGLEYVTFGDATDASGTEFADNSALGFGLTVGYSF